MNEPRVLRLRGIIPARAGFTSTMGVAVYVVKDHPRSRGVYGNRTNSYPTPPGSSPLARGLPTVIPTPPKAPGIIPARAGFTRRTWGRT